MPVPKPNIGTTLIPCVELVIEEAQLRLCREASPFDGSVSRQGRLPASAVRRPSVQSPNLQ